MSPLVLDASAAFELVTNGTTSSAASALAAHHVFAPEVMIPETLNTLRGNVLRGDLLSADADFAVKKLRQAPIRLASMKNLSQAAWALRHNVSPYDAMYIVLAQLLDTRVLTADARLARAVPERTQLIR